MGTDKSFVELCGKPLFHYAIETLETVFQEVIISSHQPDRLFNGHKVIHDHFSGCGPMAGIHAALQATSNDYVFVLSVDMPLVSMEIIHEILSHRFEYQVVLPENKGYLIPVCACYHRSVFAEIEIALWNQQLKLSRFVEGFIYKRLLLEPMRRQQLISANTPDDLLAIEQRIKKK